MTLSGVQTQDLQVHLRQNLSNNLIFFDATIVCKLVFRQYKFPLGNISGESSLRSPSLRWLNEPLEALAPDRLEHMRDTIYIVVERVRRSTNPKLGVMLESIAPPQHNILQVPGNALRTKSRTE